MVSRKYLIEMKDELHLAVAEISQSGEMKEPVLLKPRGAEVFSLESRDYENFWQWLDKEKRFVQGDEVDICVICPGQLSPAELLSSAEVLDVKLRQETEITVSDARAYLQKTERSMKEATEKEGRTLLRLMNGEELLATGRGGGKLKQGAMDASVAGKASGGKVKASAAQPIRHRPKAFKVPEVPVQKKQGLPAPKAGSPAAAPKQVPAQTAPGHKGLPKADADDIQIGIRGITENHCQGVEFRD